LNHVVAIAAGGYHSLALKSDGTVVVWGSSYLSGQGTVPADLNNVIALAAGEGHSLALKADGTVVAWGENAYGQITVPTGLAACRTSSSALLDKMAPPFWRGRSGADIFRFFRPPVIQFSF
jgi:alpha-tubulin suppressor-like RCC1 family protein